VEHASGTSSPKTIEWVDATMARLPANQVATVIWGLQRLQADVFAHQEIDKLISYLDNQRGRLDYDACKEEVRL
jgi:hypothetical protein